MVQRSVTRLAAKIVAGLAVTTLVVLCAYAVLIFFATMEYEDGRFKSWIRVLDGVVARENPDLLLPWGGTEVCTEQMIPSGVAINKRSPCNTNLTALDRCVAYSYEENLSWQGAFVPGKSETYVLTRFPLDGIAELLSDPDFHDGIDNNFLPFRFHQDRAFLDREISSETYACSDYFVTKLAFSRRQTSIIPLTMRRFRTD